MKTKDQIKDEIIEKYDEIVDMFHVVFDIDLGNDPVHQLITLESDLASLKSQLAEAGEEKKPTDEEIEEYANDYSSFIGVGGLKNNNIAKQVAFMHGARWARDF